MKKKDAMKKKDVEPGNCTADWGIAFSGSKRWTPLLPDMNATYWYYAITLDTKGTTGIEFHGQFGHARYQGFNVYNDDTGDLVWGSDNLEHKSSLRDVDIEPDAGSKNPYRPGVNRNTPNRDYTVWLVPDGTDTSAYSLEDTNVITFPPGAERASKIHLSVYLRVYLPDPPPEDQDLKDIPDYLSGWVPLPSIRAIDPKTGLAVHCPETRPFPGTGKLPPGPGENERHEVFFYRATGADYYPNQDNAYLVSIFKKINDKVAVIRVKPPTYTNTSDPTSTIPDPAEVRYWSFNVYSPKLTNVTACLADYQATVAKDGFVYLVLGRRLPSILKKAEGLNFLPWGLHEKIVLMYRHILPKDPKEFQGSAANVPVFDLDKVTLRHPREEQSADKFIGDYAPQGVYCSELGFLKDFCGFEVEYE